MNRIVAIAVFAFVLAIFAGRSVNADVQVRWSVELPARQPGWNHVRHMQQDGRRAPSLPAAVVRHPVAQLLQSLAHRSKQRERQAKEQRLCSFFSGGGR